MLTFPPSQNIASHSAHRTSWTFESTILKCNLVSVYIPTTVNLRWKHRPDKIHNLSPPTISGLAYILAKKHFAGAIVAVIQTVKKELSASTNK